MNGDGARSRFYSRQTRLPGRRWAAIAVSLMTLCLTRPSAAQVMIYVNTTQQGVTNGNCSLQEAIYSSELKFNIALQSTAPDVFYKTGCVPGSGNNDTIVLPPAAVFTFGRFWDGDGHNIY